jgi:hypothetical protein
METLKLNELVVAILAEGLAFSGIFPARPRKILLELVTCNNEGVHRSYGARIVTSIDKHGSGINFFC